jgi:hypothetical protein
VRTYDQLGVPLREVPMLSHAHHDVAMLPSGNPIVLRGFTIDAHVPELGGDVRAKSDRVAEVDPLTGETVWEWLAHDDLDTTYYPGPLSMDSVDGVYEWLHANSVVHHQPNDTVLVSFRNVSWVVLVDHATGEHLWTLGANGDFELESGEWFNGQHAASLIDDHTVILFDNGNEKGPGTTSRAVAYTVDTEAWTAREVWSWDTGVFARNYGDADRLSNGHTLVNAAGSRSGPGRVAEVSLDGEVVWDLGFHESFNNYRVTRVPWVLPAP